MKYHCVNIAEIIQTRAAAKGIEGIKIKYKKACAEHLDTQAQGRGE